MYQEKATPFDHTYRLSRTLVTRVGDTGNSKQSRFFQFSFDPPWWFGYTMDLKQPWSINCCKNHAQKSVCVCWDTWAFLQWSWMLLQQSKHTHCLSCFLSMGIYSWGWSIIDSNHYSMFCFECSQRVHKAGDTLSIMKNSCSTRPHILCNFRSVLTCKNLQLSILGVSVKLNFSRESFLSFIDLCASLDELPTDTVTWWHNPMTLLVALSL